MLLKFQSEKSCSVFSKRDKSDCAKILLSWFMHVNAQQLKKCLVSAAKRHSIVNENNVNNVR